MGIIVEGFAGVGKTSMANKYANVIDLESSSYHWIYDKEDDRTKEEKKGIKERTLNPLWPDNYIEDLIKYKDEYDIVLAYQSKSVGQRLQHVYGFMDILCYPSKECKNEYIQKYKKRNNNPDWIKMFENNFEEWIDLLSISGKNLIILNSNESIEEGLLRYGYIEKYVENGKEKIKLIGE